MHFVDNTYKTLKLTYDTPASDVINELCKRISAGGKAAEPEHHELFVIAPGSQALRERRLLREDRPLQIQVKGGSTAFKFLFREARPAPPPEEPPAAEAGGVGTPGLPLERMLRRGSLERLAEDGTTWYACTLVLDEDRLWYSQGPAGGEAGMGGGMASLPLAECDRVLECEDKRLLQLVTKGATMMFRAKSGHERNNWLLAVVKQAALIKERDILLQAERIIAGMETKRSSQHLARLEELATLPGVLAVPEARDLLLDFARRQHSAAAAGAEAEGAGGAAWPGGLRLEDVEGCLAGWEESGPGEAAEAGSIREFVESTLFQNFQAHPAVQNWLCRIAAEIG